MISIINERIDKLTHVLKLTQQESTSLTQAITQQIHSPIFNSSDFFSIHEKIQVLKINENLTCTEAKLLDQVNAITSFFEQSLFKILRTGKLENIQAIEELNIILKQLKKDPLLKNKIRPELKNLIKKMKFLQNNYQEIGFIQNKIESYGQMADEAMEKLTAQQEALEHGEINLTTRNDLSVLKVLDQIIRFYKKYPANSLPFYHSEFLSKIVREVYTIRFYREDFCAEFHSAIEVEVLKILQELHRETPVTSSLEKQYDSLLKTLTVAKDEIEHAKKIIADHLCSFDSIDEANETLLKEFRLILDQLDNDLKFFNDQIDNLYKKQTVGWMGQWKISARGRQVERHLQLMKEADTPISLGKKLLHLGMWGLYLTPQISSFVQFATQTYHAITTGESPLKQTAELMSDAAFAKHADELPTDEQQEISYDMNVIQGTLSGYLPFSESFAASNPKVADYLCTIPMEPSASNNQLIHFQTNKCLSIPILSPYDADTHAVRYLGQQVRAHYSETVKQLAWEYPHGSFLASIPYPEEKPQSMFSLYGQECVKSIKEAQTGIPIEENISFNHLQKSLETTFGSKLPTEWFEKWILKQEWNEERLGHFQGWFSHNLECQVRDHLSKQNIHVKSNEVKAVPLLLSGYESVDNSEKMKRQFEVIESPADEIYPYSEIFSEPIASRASKLTSPLAIVFSTYRFAVDIFRHIRDAATLPSDTTLLHQLGDFFGKNTGLEGFNPIEAFKFYRDLITQIEGIKGNAEQLQKMTKKIDQAIQLSRSLYGLPTDQFREKLKIALENLDPSESIFLAGGWTGKTAGHALIYEIINENPGVSHLSLIQYWRWNRLSSFGNHAFKTKNCPICRTFTGSC